MLARGWTRWGGRWSARGAILLALLVAGCGDDGDGPHDPPGADAGADAAPPRDAAPDAATDAGRDAGPDASAPVDAGDASPEDAAVEPGPGVVIGASDTDWTELDEGGVLWVFEGHQGLSHFFAAFKQQGLAIEPGVTAVYTFMPIGGGPTLIYEGAETLQVGAADFLPLEGDWMEATTGRQIVLDEPTPAEHDGETWVVQLEVTDAAGAVFRDERTVVFQTAP